MAKKNGISGSADFSTQINVALNVDGAAMAAAEASIQKFQKAIVDLGNTMSAMARGNDINKYWNTYASSIEGVSEAYKRFTRAWGEADRATAASDFIKSLHSFKALGNDTTVFLEKYGEGFREAAHEASGLAKSTVEAFSITNLKSAFESFDRMKEMGLELEDVFDKLNSKDTNELQRSLDILSTKFAKAQEDLRQAREELQGFESGAGIDVLNDKIEQLESKLSYLVDTMKEEFRDFLSANNFAGHDLYEEGRFHDYFESIEEGYTTAKEAIAGFKQEYDYLLKENAENSSGMRSVGREIDENAEALIRHGEALSNIASQSETVNDVIENLAELANRSGEAGEGINNIYDSITNVVSGLSNLNSLSEDKVIGISNMLSQIARLGNAQGTGNSVKNIAAALNSLSGIGNVSNLAILSSLDFTGFKSFEGLKVSKAALTNLATYLPPISNVNVAVLERLAGIDWSKLKTLRVNSNAIEELKKFTDTASGETGAENAATGVGSIEEKAKNAESALKGINDTVTGIRDSFVNLKEAVVESLNFDKPTRDIQSLRDEVAKLSTNIDAMTTSYERMQRVRLSAEQKANVAGEASILDSEKRAAKKAYDALLGGNYDPAVVAELTARYREFVSAISDVEAKHKTLGAQGQEVISMITAQGAAFRNDVAALGELAKESQEAEAAQEKLAGAAKKQEDQLKANNLKEYVKDLASIRKEVNSMQNDLMALVNSGGKYEGLEQAIEDSLRLDRLLTDKEQRSKLGQTGSLDYLRKQVAVLKENTDGMMALAKAEAEAADEAKKLEKTNAAESMKKMLSELNKIQTEAKNGLSSLSDSKYDEEAVLGIRQHYQELVDKIAEYRTGQKEVTEDVVTSLRSEANAIQDSIDALKRKTSAAQESARAEQTGAKQTELSARREATLLKQAEGLRGRISTYIQGNTKAYSMYGEQLNRLLSELNQNASITPEKLSQIATEFAKIQNAAKLAGATGKTFFDSLKDIWKRYSGWTLITKAMMAVLNTFKKMISNVKELDAAMTELKKVTDLTAAGYQRFFNTAAKTAKEIGATITDTINATADFARLGYGVEEAASLAKAALVYKNVGDGINSINDASESLISTLKAFGDEAYDAMQIVDMFNEVGKLLPMPVVTRCLVVCYIGQNSVGLCA